MNIIDRILIFCAKLSIVSCELNVVHFDIDRICEHLKRISSSPVELLPLTKRTLRKHQDFSLWEVVESVSCSCEHKLIDTGAFRLVSEKF